VGVWGICHNVSKMRKQEKGKMQFLKRKKNKTLFVPQGKKKNRENQPQSGTINKKKKHKRKGKGRKKREREREEVFIRWKKGGGESYFRPGKKNGKDGGHCSSYSTIGKKEALRKRPGKQVKQLLPELVENIKQTQKRMTGGNQFGEKPEPFTKQNWGKKKKRAR